MDVRTVGELAAFLSKFPADTKVEVFDESMDSFVGFHLTEWAADNNHENFDGVVIYVE